MSREKRALVLSGGGMFGAYQAGVWLELASVFRPDMVVGASVGSLNGWHIAAGLGAPELAERWLDLRDGQRPRWRIPRSLADGCIDSSTLEDEIRLLCTSELKTDYGVVLTELPAMRPKLFRAPEVTWRHVAASCSVPLFLRQHRIDGVYYSDGGLVDPLPLWAALEMGASTVVTLNLLPHRPWWIRHFVRGLQRCTGYEPCRRGAFTLIDISPSAPLGSARDSMYWSRSRAESWVQLGRADARRHIPSVVKWQG